MPSNAGIGSTDNAAANNLANLLRSRRLFARAESLYRAPIESGRGTQTSYGNLVGVLLDQGKFVQAESVLAAMRAQFPSAPGSFSLPPIILYARGQIDSTDAYYRARINDPNPVIRISAISSLSTLAVLRGRLRDAKTLSDQARQLNVARGVPESPYAESIQRASLEIWFLEQHEKGVQEIDATLARTPLRSMPVEQRPYFNFASLYALAGRPDKARALIAQFDADVRDTTIRTLLVPSRHNALAEIALAEKKPLDAVREFWKADSLPDGPAGECGPCIFADLGRAYDLANLPDSAIAYWERHIETPFPAKSSSESAVLAGIHKRLGELYEAKGDRSRAVSHYDAFLALWKNADPELQPKVEEVRRRVAKMKDLEKR